MLQFEGATGVDLLSMVGDLRKTLVVDDFHYIGRDVQKTLVEQFKEAARAGCTIVVVSVPHRADDVIRANPDLRGRLRLIEVPYWTEDELANIAWLGFPKLNMAVQKHFISRLTEESLSSPQLMQSMCLDFCRVMEVDETLPELQYVEADQKTILKVLTAVAAASSCQTALDILQKGPRIRGTERKTYTTVDGVEGDVYTVLLKAIAFSDPQLTLTYPEIRDRVTTITEGEPPSGSSIVSSLGQMDEAAREMKQDRVLEWDAEKKRSTSPTLTSSISCAGATGIRLLPRPQISREPWLRLLRGGGESDPRNRRLFSLHFATHSQ